MEVIVQNIVSTFFLIVLTLQISSAQQFLERLDFSGENLEENQMTVSGAGFDQYPIADYSFGEIPTDNAFEGATDGQGMLQ